MDSTITQWSGACQGSGSEGPRVQSPRATAAGQWEARLTTPLQNWPVWSWTERHPGQRRGLPFKIRRVTINQTEMWSYWYFTGIWGCPCGQVRQISRGEGSRRNVGARSPFGCLAHVLGLFCVSFGGILRHLVDKIQKRGVTKLKEDGLWGGRCGTVMTYYHTFLLRIVCARALWVRAWAAWSCAGSLRRRVAPEARRRGRPAAWRRALGGGGRLSLAQWKWRRRPAQCRKLSLFWIAFNSSEQAEKTIQKTQEPRRKEDEKKKRKTRELLLVSFHRYLPSPVFRCSLFFCASSAREKPPKHKVEREKCEATGLCVSTRRQDSLLIHAVQCNGTWTRVIVACKCCDNRVCDHIYLLFFLLRCPVAAIEKRGEAG